MAKISLPPEITDNELQSNGVSRAVVEFFELAKGESFFGVDNQSLIIIGKNWAIRKFKRD
jgi:hypothetical protein